MHIRGWGLMGWGLGEGLPPMDEKDGPRLGLDLGTRTNPGLDPG